MLMPVQYAQRPVHWQVALLAALRNVLAISCRSNTRACCYLLLQYMLASSCGKAYLVHVRECSAQSNDLREWQLYAINAVPCRL